MGFKKNKNKIYELKLDNEEYLFRYPTRSEAKEIRADIQKFMTLNTDDNDAGIDALEQYENLVVNALVLLSEELDDDDEDLAFSELTRTGGVIKSPFTRVIMELCGLNYSYEDLPEAEKAEKEATFPSNASLFDDLGGSREPSE